MGQSWFSGRRRNEYHYAPTPIADAAASPPFLPPARPASDLPSPVQDPPPPPPPPPPTPPGPAGTSFSPYYYSQCSPYHPPSRQFFPYYVPPGGGGGGGAWWNQQPAPPNYRSSSSAWMPPAHMPPPYVEHQQAKKIKNDVNVHKDTIRLEADEERPDQYLVSFTFDAAVDGSISIFYFANGGDNYTTFSSIYPELSKPMKTPFQKGSGQKFRQSPGSSVDLGFFDVDDLSKCENNIFPLVICAETDQPHAVDEPHLEQTLGRAQVTLAVIEKKGDGPFQVKVIKQVLWIDGHPYQLQELYGLASSTETKLDDDEGAGKECVICMTEPRDTAVLPCRHTCMCSECAKALGMHTNKCPICRQPIERLVEIKVNSDD